MELSMKKFWRHQWWVITVLTTIPLVALAAQITFEPGRVISSDDVNNNFNDLYDRTAGLPLRVQIVTGAGCAVSADVSDCTCPNNSVPIGGGAAAGGQANVLNASQALPAASPTFWRTACANTTTGARVTCVAPFAVCLFIR
jgi:hypothetical protein